MESRPCFRAIRNARKSIEIVIFRFDRAELEAGLKAAVARGVSVSALIAYTNRGGEINLRKLEMRLLEVGVAVSRTASDLLRYHDKLMIIDRRLLYVLSFNFTHQDIDHSRAFGVVTRDVSLVHEAVRLFEADTSRQPYTPKLDSFVVSPANAREVLSAFIRKASKQLLIYDPRIADPEILRVLNERSKAGVEIKVIGRVSGRSLGLEVRKLVNRRLHTRTIICDRSQAFVGSQSLRRAELDSRREVGVIFHEPKSVNKLIRTFEADWDTGRSRTAAIPDQALQAGGENHGQGAVAAQSHRRGSGRTSGVGKGGHDPGSEGNESNDQGSGAGSRPGACQGNGRRIPGGVCMKCRICVTVMLPCLSLLAFAGQSPEPQVSRQERERVVKIFNARVRQYVNLRKDMEASLPALKPTKEVAQITDHQHSLAAKIAQARRAAHQGDIFTPTVTQHFREIIRVEFKGPVAQLARKTIHPDDPSKVVVGLRVNDVYPEDMPLITMPPTLLSKLPPLPRDLTYQIVGRDLALKDTKAGLIVDLIPNAIP